jgi:myo-inositol-1(or 4)-monophosphatase
MVTLRDCWEWDIAAGDLIVREAGGRATDRFGKNLCFNNPTPKRPGVLAGSNSIHENLLKRL